MGEKGDHLVNLKSILISIASAAALSGSCAVTRWNLADAVPGTGRVTRVVQFLPHENNPDFFIRYLQRQYSNDMKTVQGRVKWHGKPVMQEIDDTNRMCKIERFADGTVHVSPFRKPQPYDNLSFHAKTNHPAWKANVAKRKALLEKRRAAIAARKNIIPGLKEAQLKTFDNKNTESNVTVNVNIGRSPNGR